MSSTGSCVPAAGWVTALCPSSAAAALKFLSRAGCCFLTLAQVFTFLITESLRLEKTFKVVESHHKPKHHTCTLHGHLQALAAAREPDCWFLFVSSVQGSRILLLPPAVRDHAVRPHPGAAGGAAPLLPAHRAGVPDLPPAPAGACHGQGLTPAGGFPCSAGGEEWVQSPHHGRGSLVQLLTTVPAA